MLEEKSVFKYSLEALLTKRGVDLSVLLAERADVERVLSGKQEQYNEISLILNDAESQLRCVMADCDGIATERVRAISAFILQQCEIADSYAREIENIRMLSNQLLERIKRTKQSIKGLEKHKDRKAKDQHKVLQRAQYRDADGLWLLIRNGKVL